MIKTDIRVFKIKLNNRENSSSLICVACRIGTVGDFYGAEFYQLVTTFDDSALSIPNSRFATFQEELRATSNAFAIVKEYRQNFENWINLKMQEAYGLDIIINIEDCAINS